MKSLSWTSFRNHNSIWNSFQRGSEWSERTIKSLSAINRPVYNSHITNNSYTFDSVISLWALLSQLHTEPESLLAEFALEELNQKNMWSESVYDWFHWKSSLVISTLWHLKAHIIRFRHADVIYLVLWSWWDCLYSLQGRCQSILVCLRRVWYGFSTGVLLYIKVNLIFYSVTLSFPFMILHCEQNAECSDHPEVSCWLPLAL